MGHHQTIFQTHCEGIKLPQEFVKDSFLFEKVFKSEEYLQAILEAGATPILIGKWLQRLIIEEECSEGIKLVLGILNGPLFPCDAATRQRRDIRNSLHEHTYDPDTHEAQLTGSNITLMLQDGDGIYASALVTTLCNKTGDVWSTYTLDCGEETWDLQLYRFQIPSPDLAGELLFEHPFLTRYGRPLCFSIQEYGPRPDSVRRWKAARTWRDMISENVRFIRESAEGKDVETFYHGGPLDPETKELIPSLLRLNSYGLLTVGSQSAEDTQLHHSGMYFQVQQIPFLDFLIPYSEGTRVFLEQLVEDKDLACTITEFRTPPATLFPGSIKETITVTRERCGKSRRDIRRKSWQDIVTNQPTSGHLEDPRRAEIYQPITDKHRNGYDGC